MISPKKDGAPEEGILNGIILFSRRCSSLSPTFRSGADQQQVTHMGRAFTAATLLLLLGALGAATANVSGGGGRQEPIEKTLLFSIHGCLRGGLILNLGDFLLNSGGRLLLDERGLRRRAVVLRLRAQALRLPLRPLRRHQPLPAHCKPPSHFASILPSCSSEGKRPSRGGAAVVLCVWFAVLNSCYYDDLFGYQICSLLQVDLPGRDMSG